MNISRSTYFVFAFQALTFTDNTEFGSVKLVKVLSSSRHSNGPSLPSEQLSGKTALWSSSSVVKQSVVTVGFPLGISLGAEDRDGNWLGKSLGAEERDGGIDGVALGRLDGFVLGSKEG